MGTRSRIARQNDDGTFTSIYCHWDGYPDHHGPILLDHYSSRAKSAKLMELGDLSSLGSGPGEKHDFDAASNRDWCTAYGRDRGEKGVEAETSSTLEELATLTQNCGGEHLYVHMKDGTWMHAEGGIGWFGMPASEAPDTTNLNPLELVVAGLNN